MSRKPGCGAQWPSSSGSTRSGLLLEEAEAWPACALLLLLLLLLLPPPPEDSERCSTVGWLPWGVPPGVLWCCCTLAPASWGAVCGERCHWC